MYPKKRYCFHFKTTTYVLQTLIVFKKDLTEQIDMTVPTKKILDHQQLSQGSRIHIVPKLNIN